jgi:hypothetical protein
MKMKCTSQQTAEQPIIFDGESFLEVFASLCTNDGLVRIELVRKSFERNAQLLMALSEARARADGLIEPAVDMECSPCLRLTEKGQRALYFRFSCRDSPKFVDDNE